MISRRASAIADSGVCDAGFSTIGQPAAIAGATLWATRFSGKLNGLIAPTTPIGTRSVKRELALADVGRVHGHHLAGERAGLGGGERERRHRAPGLDASGLDRLGRFLGDGAGELLVPLAEQLRGAIEDLGALPRRQRALAVHRGRRRDRAIHLLGVARGHAVDLVPVEG